MIELIMAVADWPAMGCVLLQFWYMSKGMERRAFCCALVGAVFWTMFAIPISSWALLTLQVAITYLSIRGLMRLRRRGD